jgi:hypothetical protein
MLWGLPFRKELADGWGTRGDCLGSILLLPKPPAAAPPMAPPDS